MRPLDNASLLRCVPDRYVPTLERIPTVNNHKSYILVKPETWITISSFSHLFGTWTTLCMPVLRPHSPDRTSPPPHKGQIVQGRIVCNKWKCTEFLHFAMTHLDFSISSVAWLLHKNYCILRYSWNVNLCEFKIFIAILRSMQLFHLYSIIMND